MELTGKAVLVVGSGISGIAAVSLLRKNQAACILYDSSEQVSGEEIREKLSEAGVPAGEDASLQIVTGPFEESLADRADLAVLSPGVPVDAPFVKLLQEKGVPVWGEVELAWQYARGTLAAITGTNGKTTTTALTGAILQRHFESVFVVGNIGIPYTSIAAETKPESVTVAEISSFQLETIHDFHPQVSAILNITPDHLNRHHTMENYQNAKFSIAKNQNRQDVCVLNYDDPVTRKFGMELQQTNVLFFSRQEKLSSGVCLDGEDTILYGDGQQLRPVCQVSKMQLMGDHNVENVMAAVGIAAAMGVPVDTIRDAVYDFKAVEHRIEYVAEINGVTYYNDSKGTNTDAAIKGIQSMVRPTVLIAGGYDKQSPYEDWIRACLGKMKTLILIGQTAQDIARAAREQNFTNILFADDLKEAVQTAAGEACPGDAVLLSPACASWGMFKNYEERGRLFKEYVHSLEE